jgi:hypothetical protein
VVTVLSVPLGWVGWKLQQVHRERATTAWIEKIGGEASSNRKFLLSERSWWEKTTEKWFGERIRYVSCSASSEVRHPCS